MKPHAHISRIGSYLEELDKNGFTTKSVAVDNCTDVMPEFGRWQDVERLFGIKRGLLYLLVAEGRIKSVSLRRKGNQKGCRLFYLQSVSQYLHCLMTEQSGQSLKNPLIKTPPPNNQRSLHSKSLEQVSHDS